MTAVFRLLRTAGQSTFSMAQIHDFILKSTMAILTHGLIAWHRKDTKHSLPLTICLQMLSLEVDWTQRAMRTSASIPLRLLQLAQLLVRTLKRQIEREHSESLLPAALTSHFIPCANHMFVRITEHLLYFRVMSCLNIMLTMREVEL